jgi:hypothetical protein
MRMVNRRMSEMGTNSLPIGTSMIRVATYVADAALEKLFPVSFRSLFIPMTAAYW